MKKRVSDIHTTRPRTAERARKKTEYRLKTTPYMNELWYPEAKQDVLENSGYMYTSYPWRGVLHTTEGSTYAAARSAYIANRSAPHFTVSFEGGTFRAWQHIPLDRAARALRNQPGGVETNRLRTIQIEIVGFAHSSQDFSVEYLTGIAKLMRWIESNTEIEATAPRFYGEGEGIVLASQSSPVRMSNAQWLAFNGWCGHQHVPENDHWDPGRINISYLLSVTTGVRPMYDPPIPIQMVDSHTDPENGGVWVLDSSGAVFALNGARYWGGPNGKPYWGSRKAARIKTGAEAQAEMGGNWSIYKYVIYSVDGGHYGYPS